MIADEADQKSHDRRSNLLGPCLEPKDESDKRQHKHQHNRVKKVCRVPGEPALQRQKLLDLGQQDRNRNAIHETGKNRVRRIFDDPGKTSHAEQDLQNAGQRYTGDQSDLGRGSVVHEIRIGHQRRCKARLHEANRRLWGPKNE